MERHSVSVKPTDYPDDREARLDQEWRAYDDYYSEQTLNTPYFYHQPKKRGEVSGQSHGTVWNHAQS